MLIMDLESSVGALREAVLYDDISINHFFFSSSNEKAWSLGREQGGVEKGPETEKEPVVYGECGRGASGALRMTGEV